MKTQTNISNLRRASLTVLSAMFLTSVSVFAGNPDSDLINLEKFISKQEKTLKYISAERMENEIVASAARLNEMFNAADASLKYEAPEADEAIEVENAMERIENLVASSEDSFKYQAPVEDETIEVFFELQNLDSLVAATDEALMYRAPETAEDVYFDNISEPVNVEYMAELNR